MSSHYKTAPRLTQPRPSLQICPLLHNKNIGFPDKETTPPWKWWSFSEVILAEFRTDSHFLPCRRAHNELPQLTAGCSQVVLHHPSLRALQSVCAQSWTQTTPRKQVSFHPALGCRSSISNPPYYEYQHWKCTSCSHRLCTKHCSLQTFLTPISVPHTEHNSHTCPSSQKKPAKGHVGSAGARGDPWLMPALPPAPAVTSEPLDINCSLLRDGALWCTWQWETPNTSKIHRVTALWLTNTCFKIFNESHGQPFTSLLLH